MRKKTNLANNLLLGEFFETLLISFEQTLLIYFSKFFLVRSFRFFDFLVLSLELESKEKNWISHLSWRIFEIRTHTAIQNKLKSNCLLLFQLEKVFNWGVVILFMLNHFNFHFYDITSCFIFFIFCFRFSES